MKMDTRKLSTLAMMCALAFILAAFVRVPVVTMPGLNLRYDPKDVIIVIAGFIYGPLAAFMVTVVVALTQWFSGVSLTAHWGFIMNVSGSAAFCCTAALIYKKYRTMKGAILGLVVGGIFATAVMMLLNIFVVPLFMERVTREAVIALLIPAFLPFNVISNAVNIAFTVLLYKHVKTVLQASRMMPQSEEGTTKRGVSMAVLISAVFVLLACGIWVLILQGFL